MQLQLTSSVWWRSFLPIVLVAAIGVFTNLLTDTIGNTENYRWQDTIAIGWFWAILVAALILGRFQVMVSRHDTEMIEQRRDIEFFDKVMDGSCDAVIKRYEELIAAGDIEKLESDNMRFRRIFSREKQ